MITKLKKFLNWRNSQKPDYNPSLDLYVKLGTFRLPLVLLIGVFMIGTLGYMLIDGMNLNDAMYQAGITFTTVGFGEIAPISTLGRYFTIALIILGFAVFTFSLGLIVETIAKGNLLLLIKERSMIYEIARLKEHVILFYNNASTIELAKAFNKAHIPFVVVDDSLDFLEQAVKLKYPYYIKAAPNSTIAFQKSYLSSAKTVVTLAKQATENIAQISTIRLFENQLKRKKKYKIITISDDANNQRLRDLGADIVINPHHLMAQRIISMALNESMESILEEFLCKKDTPIDMEEIKIPRNSWIIFKKLKEIHMRESSNVSVVGIREEGGRFIPMPKGESQILMHSSILVVGEPQNIRNVKLIINQKTKPDSLKFI